MTPPRKRLARHSTRKLIALILFGIACLPLIAAAWWLFRGDLREFARERDQRLSMVARDISKSLRGEVDFALDATRAASNTPGLAELLGAVDIGQDADLARRHLFAIASRDPLNIRSAALLDRAGTVRASTLDDESGRDESTHDWQRSLGSNHAVQMYGPVHWDGSDELQLVAAAPVRDRGDRIVGALRVRFDMGLVDQTLHSSLRNRPGLGAMLLDDSGHAVVASGSEIAAEVAARAIGTAPKNVLGNDGRVDARALAVLVPRTGWRLVVYEPDSVRSSQVRERAIRWFGMLLLLSLLLLGAASLIGWLIARPIERLTRTFDAIAGGDLQRRAEPGGTREFQHLATAMNAMSGRLADNIGQLSEELRQRSEAEHSLRRSEERLSRLIEQIPGTVYRCRIEPHWTIEFISAQVEELTGLPAQDLRGQRGRALGELVHPDDRARVESRVRSAVAERRPLDLRYRLIHRNGSIRWVWERGQAQGEGEEAVFDAVLLDVSEQERAERAMRLLQDSTEGRTGGDYFSSLPHALCRALDMRLAVLVRREQDGHLGVLAVSHAGEPSDLPLESGILAACAEVDASTPRVIASGFAERYADTVSTLESAVIQPLSDTDGRLLGMLAVFDDKPLHDGPATVDLLDVCAARAVAEIERNQAQLALHVLAAELEHRVEQRTADLEASHRQLSMAMDQLVQTEKLASLGSLVAGVAHELNTPIGNALTASTSLQDSLRQFGRELAGGQLRRSTLTSFIAEGKEAGELVERNLHRAAELISHFKQVAVDQTSSRRRKFDLRTTAEEVLSTLLPRMKRLPHRVELDIGEGIVMDSIPGALEQVLTNLVSNSLDHAFTEGQAGTIAITARSDGEQIELRFRDDGQGIPAERQKRVFDPFYTTRLGSGGSGLGLYLVYSLVTGPLGGRVELRSEPGRGTEFELQLPVCAPTAAGEEPSHER